MYSNNQEDLKRIVMVIVGSFPYGNMNTARIKNIANGLSSLGWNTAVANIFPNRFAAHRMKNLSQWNHTEVYRLHLFKTYQTNRLKRFIQMISGMINSLVLVSKLKKGNVVYFYNPTLLDTSWSMVLARVRGLKIVVDQTELYSIERFRILNKVSERITSSIADQIWALSSRIVAHFDKRSQKDVLRSKIMVDIDRFVIDQISEDCLLGYIGSFAEKDGIENMINGVSVAIKQMPRLKLRLIGYCENRERLEFLIAKYRLQDNVEILGQVEFQDIPRLLKECDSLVMNRTSSEFAETGYPIKLGEYFACERPVLMSDGKGFSEDFNHLEQAIKYKQDNAQALADAIIWRYENREEAEKIATTGFQYAKEHFDAQKNVSILSDSLIELCKE